MARIRWLDPVSGNFDTAADWAGGVAPGASDVAYLGGSGKTAYTVTASASETVKGVDTSSNATLAITGGVFTATKGTAGGVNAGTISVGSGAVLAAGGRVRQHRLDHHGRGHVAGWGRRPHPRRRRHGVDGSRL